MVLYPCFERQEQVAESNGNSREIHTMVMQQLAATVGWSFVGVVLFYLGIRLFDLLDPIDYQAEIRNGNMAAGVILAAVVVSIATIIISVIVF
ncbi:DUF350 domain-containing protein [Leptothoe kymatousa]|nr:DUF350 domain-containing protein [Leptothoe kymatousa]